MLQAAPQRRFTPVSLAVTAASLMLVLAVATVVTIAAGAPLGVSTVLALVALAVRPCAVLHHRRTSRTGA